MTCSACSASVEKNVKKVDGVQSVNVNLLTNSMTVDYDHGVTDNNKIIGAVVDAGYNASVFVRGTDKTTKTEKDVNPVEAQVKSMTEAALLLNEPYRAGPYSKAYIDGLLKRLSGFGPQQIVLTGVYFDEENLGAAAYDRKTGDISYVLSSRIEGSYHGTGDVFASALLGAMLNGFSLSKAVRIAVNFTAGSIVRTKQAKTDVRFGVNFEAGIPQFIQELGLSQ